MTVAVESADTQTAVLNTEHTLSAPTAVGVRVLVVDLANLAAGDTVELRISRAALDEGTERLVHAAAFVGPVAEPIAISPPVPMPYGGTFTLKQTTGTPRDFPWSVETL